MPRTGRPPKSISERFWDKVDVGARDECWIWKGGKHPYGKLFIHTGYHAPAHQVSWELHNGQKVPDGLQVLHECDNPPCVNPYHLFVGTPLDNMQDKIKKGRAIYKPCVGEANGKHKLTDQDVLDIREKYQKGMSCIDIADEYGIHRTHATRVAFGRRRTHVQ